MIVPRISLLLTGFAVFGTPISVYGLDTCCLDTVCQYCVPPPEENIGYCKSFKERMKDPDCPIDTECEVIFGCVSAPINPEEPPVSKEKSFNTVARDSRSLVSPNLTTSASSL